MSGCAGRISAPGRPVPATDILTQSINVLVVDDSALVRKVLSEELSRFADIEVVVSGGYSPNEVSESAMVVHAAATTYQSAGIASTLHPRGAGSWPGVMFTGAPLGMAAVHFGGGIGGGAHAPNEWLLIESKNAKVAGFDDAAILYADFLYDVARGSAGGKK